MHLLCACGILAARTDGAAAPLPTHRSVEFFDPAPRATFPLPMP